MAFDVNALGERVEVVGMDGFCITPRRSIGRRCVLRGVSVVPPPTLGTHAALINMVLACCLPSSLTLEHDTLPL